MPQGQIRSIAIVGGGVTGWLAGSLLARVLRGSCTISVIETADGEVPRGAFGTLPSLTGLHAILGIDENELLGKTGGTFRLADEFRDWSRPGQAYFHALGETGASLDSIPFRHLWLKLRQSGLHDSYSDFNLCAAAARAGKFARPSSDRRSVLSTLEYAYHLDAARYAAFLRDHALARGVEGDAGHVAGVAMREAGTTVEAVVLGDGRRVAADLFIDCTGSAARIAGTLGGGFEDWSEWLVCDRAVAITTPRQDPLLPSTQLTAGRNGWRWCVPLQHASEQGVVYSSRFTSDDEALSALPAGVSGAGQRRSWRFASGRRRKIWNGNVVALGASAATFEPLENLEIHLAQVGITRLLALFPDTGFAASEREEYNRLMASELDRMRDFLILHYHATTRSDSAFWDHCRDMRLPETLAHKVRMFRSRGRVVLYDDETFSEDSWTSVLLGQEVIPRRHDPLTDRLDIAQLKTQLQRMRSTVQQGAGSMLSHEAFIRKNCAARTGSAG
jgi:tryptophan halogenase